MNNTPFQHLNEDDNDFLPVLSYEEEKEDDLQESLPRSLPILPLRNTVLFPGVVFPITVGRDKSIKLIRQAYSGDKLIGVFSQKDMNIEDPGFDDLQYAGTLAKIVKMLRMPDGNTTVIIQGKKRIIIAETESSEQFLMARVEAWPETRPDESDKEFNALISSMRDMAYQIIELSPNIPSEASIALRNIESPLFLVNFIASNLNIELSRKQLLLEIQGLKERAQEVLTYLTQELQLLELKNQIQSKVKTDMDRQQREYFLHQQLKTIQEELGGATPDLEVQNLRERGISKKWPEAVAKAFYKELDKLQRMNPAAADYSVVLNYVELMLELPWDSYTKDKFDLKRASRILDEDHFGLEKVKDRILEYLAVLKLKANMKAPILCLVGPPGVGKTSLGRSIAKSVGREYVRMSLGGVHDEAVIRGHRKTYIGAMPGRILQSLKKAGSSNPVFVLDEIDKVGQDIRGDISSALLEVLDPEQNNTFFDHYLELDYDLSKVMFIATANSLSSLQPALIDRMEIIEINGYTLEEKVEIARKYLLPKQLNEHGLKTGDLKVPNELLAKIAEEYTRESGVRAMDKKLASLVRGIAKRKALGENYDKKLNQETMVEILGVRQFDKDRYQISEKPGVVTGLAWTSAGGDILYIEALLGKGKAGYSITGNLGDVMKESAALALAYVKAHAEKLGISDARIDETHVHIHLPEGATPKDGPSAGITMLTALVSAFKNKPILPGIAMTGEITLRGKVLPVGGIKEKILAAKRAGIQHIILCKDNKKDIDEIKPHYLQDLQFHFVEEMEEVLRLAGLLDESK